jgi:DNA-binding winged helix-turn-helix (wHTH) protein/Flp pilus assembly protein TadD
VFLKVLERETTAGPPTAYVFGDFRLDLARRLLLRQSQVVPVPERVFQILSILIEANGSVVQRETIASRVWPDAAVADGNIAQHIYLLRQILGEHARDRALIMTVNGKGYRLTVPVKVEPQGLDDNEAAVEAHLRGSKVEPFRDYCQGSYLLERRAAPALRRAIEIFESTLQADPEHVPALIGLARAYALLGEYWHVPPATAFAKAKNMVWRALAIAPSSATAHAVLSGLLMFADWDWAGAKSELDAALRFNPNSPIVRNNAAYYYICAGEHDRALFEAQRALMMEPSSLSRQLLFGQVLIHAGRYGQGIACMSRLIESDADFYIARRYRAQAFLLNRQPEEALTDLLLLPQERSEEPCFRLPLLGRAYADCGDALRAEQAYLKLQAMTESEYVVWWNLAIVAAGTGRLDDALTHLELALENREPALLFLKSLPWFTPIAESSRFKEILRIVGP